MKYTILLEARIKPVHPEVLRREICKILKNNHYDIEEIYVERVDIKDNPWNICELTVPCDKMIPYIYIDNAKEGRRLMSDEKTKSELIKMGKKLGWEPRDSEYGLSFAANYAPKVEIDRNKPLYHVTNEDNAKKILKNGIKPKSMAKYATPRVYVFRDLNDAKEYVKNSCDRTLQGASSFAEIGDYKPVKPFIYILEIDPSKFGANYYNDLEISYYNSAIWTYSHIPANAIKIHSRHFIALPIFIEGISKKDQSKVFKRAFSKLRYKDDGGRKFEKNEYKGYIINRFYLIDPWIRGGQVSKHEQKLIIDKISRIVEKIKDKFSVIIITSDHNIISAYNIINNYIKYLKGSVIWDPSLKSF